MNLWVSLQQCLRQGPEFGGEFPPLPNFLVGISDSRGGFPEIANQEITGMSHFFFILTGSQLGYTEWPLPSSLLTIKL